MRAERNDTFQNQRQSRQQHFKISTLRLGSNSDATDDICLLPSVSVVVEFDAYIFPVQSRRSHPMIDVDEVSLILL